MYRDYKQSSTVTQQSLYHSETPSHHLSHPSGYGEAASDMGNLSVSSSISRISSPTGTNTSSGESSASSFGAPSSQTTNNSTRLRQFTPRPHQAIGDRRFLEICVNTGDYTISLGEIDITTVATDGELFGRVAQSYRELRGAHFKRVFMKPANIHYVLVCKRSINGHLSNLVQLH